MTDRVATLTVILSDDTRDDDATDLANAISRIRGVSSVELGPVVNIMDAIERSRLRGKIANDVFVYISTGELPK